MSRNVSTYHRYVWLTLQELYRHLPGQRKLSTELKEKAEGLLGLKANKKLIQQQLSVESDSIILLKDLSNISTCAKRKKTRNDLESTVKTLTDKYGMCTL